MKVYKLTVMVIDFDGIGSGGVKSAIEDTKYPNRCISPHMVGIDERDIGEWDDSHPLNHRDKAADEFNRLFADTKDKP